MASPVKLKVLMDLSDGVEFDETDDYCFDISDIVMTAHTRRGRNQQLDKIQAGYAVITIVDENGDFNPDNTASPYYGKLVPGRKLRLYPLYDDGTGEFRYPDMFTGYISNYNLKFSVGVDSANEVIIEAYDALRIFNSVSITQVINSTTDDTCDERIDAILDEISWPAGLRNFETSSVQLDADPGDMRTVLDAIRQVEDTEAGLFYIDGSGVAQFKNRATVNEPPAPTDAYYFADDGTATTYNDLKLIQDDSLLYNKVTVRSYNGTDEVTVTDTSSIDTYFTRSAERNDVLLSATSDLELLADTLLENNKDSSLEIQNIMLNLSQYEDIDRVVAGLYFEIFFVPINVVKTLAGNTVVSRLGYINGVNHDITPNRWFTTAFTGLTSNNTVYWLLSDNTHLFQHIALTNDGYFYALDDSTTTVRLYYFKANGLLIWARQFTQLWTNVYGFVVDSSNNLYISGNRGSGPSLVKINNAGTKVWDIRGTDNSYTYYSLAISDTSLYLGGRYPQANPYPAYGLLKSIDFDGNINWQLTNKPTDPYASPFYLNTNKGLFYYDNAIYAVSDSYITKYETDGDRVWSYRLTPTNGRYQSLLLKQIHINSVTEKIWVNGSLTDTDPTPDIERSFIIQLTDNGSTATLDMQEIMEGPSLIEDNVQSITNDSDGNTYILTWDAGIDYPNQPTIILKYDNSGVRTMQRQITQGSSRVSIDIDNNDNLYLVNNKNIAFIPNDGSHTGSYDFPAAFPWNFDYQDNTYTFSTNDFTIATITPDYQSGSETFATNELTVTEIYDIFTRYPI